MVGADREIRSTGFNGFPRGIADDNERLTNREMKYPLICHAEENAIMHAARIGMPLKECTAYVTWPPCTRCARSLIQAGVSEVVVPEGCEIPERWEQDFNPLPSCSKKRVFEFASEGRHNRTVKTANHWYAETWNGNAAAPNRSLLHVQQSNPNPDVVVSRLSADKDRFPTPLKQIPATFRPIQSITIGRQSRDEDCNDDNSLIFPARKNAATESITTAMATSMKDYPARTI